jgi:hypothetical protein
LHAKMAPRSRPAAKRETSALLKEPSTVLDAGLSKEARLPAYAISGDRVLLLLPGGYGRIYESREELLTFVREGRERAGRDLVKEALPQQQRFVAQLEQLLQAVPDRLGIEAGALDYSEKSLAQIDRAIKKLGIERALTSDIFPVVVAYVGEVIRRALDGRWEVREESRRGCWEPWITAPGGYECMLTRLYKEVMEGTASTRAFADVHIVLARRMGG